jgi:hypothetical protein
VPFADEFINPDLELSVEDLAKWSPSQETHTYAKDLEQIAMGFAHGIQIPRRLVEATAPEMAQDKKRMRKLYHGYLGLVGGWQRIAGDEWEPEDSEEAHQFGAQVILDDWIPERLDFVASERARLATIGVQAGQRKWANRVINVLNNEEHTIRRTQ